MVMLTSLGMMLSIVYGVSNNYFGPLMVLKMSLGTSISTFFFSFGFLLTDHKKGFMATLTSPQIGGRIARTFLPMVIFFPLLLGVIYLAAQRRHYFEPAFGLALFSVLSMLVFFLLIIRTGRLNNDTHQKLEAEEVERKKAEEQASSSELFSSIIYENIPSMVFVKDVKNFRFRSINKAGEQMVGKSREELAGKTDYEIFPRAEADYFREKDIEALETGMPLLVEELMTTPNGLRWMRTRKIGVRDENGRPLYILGIVEDITDLKKKQEDLNKYNIELERKVEERTRELATSEKRFYSIIQSAPDAIIISNEKETIQLVNTQTEKLFGYSKDELLGKQMEILIPDRFKKSGMSGQELFGKTKKGNLFPIEISLSPIETSDGVLISVSVRDITERKKAENILVENELKFRDLTQNVPGVIYQWIKRYDGTDGFTYVSPKLTQYFGLHPSEIEKIPGLIHPDDKDRWRTSIRDSNVNETPWFFEGRLLFPDGTIRWWRFQSNFSVKNEEGRLYNGIMIDITGQKEIEQQILDNQKRFEAIFNSQYQFMGLLTTDGILIECNETALNFAGLRVDDVIGKPFWECYWWAISGRMQEQLKQSIVRAARGEFIRYEADILGKGGIIATIDFSIKPVLDDDGKVILLIPEGRDITQRKLLEQRAREQEEQIRLFVKHTPAAIAMFDNQMRYMVASDRWYRDYGLEGMDIIGKSHYKVFPDVDNMPHWKAIHQRCLNGAIEVREQDAFPRSDGTIDWIRFEIYPWKTSSDKIGGIIMFTEVITEKIKVQEDLRKLNRKLIESNKELEQFAYVASHDLQEPLRMVSSFLQLLEKKYKSQLDDSAHQYIHFAVDGSERMKTLINDLLKFSRVGTTVEESSEVDCNLLVKNVIKVYEQKINESEAKLNVQTLPVVKANKTQLEQLFQNLLGNALKYRGKDAPYIEIGAREEGPGWVFYVKDNGIGIESKFFDKVFVIFQRLHGKNEYGGTGIGLAICKKIVEKHGGKIWIESDPGKGTTFFFSFPKPETAKLLIDQEQL
jgi:PAS domain S-box-containing protein